MMILPGSHRQPAEIRAEDVNARTRVFACVNAFACVRECICMHACVRVGVRARLGVYKKKRVCACIQIALIDLEQPTEIQAEKVRACVGACVQKQYACVFIP